MVGRTEMKKVILILLFGLLANKSLAVPLSSLPGGPVTTNRQAPIDQLGYKSESVNGIDLNDLYTVQLIEFNRKREAQLWVRDKGLISDDIGIAYILDNGTASYIVATGVYQGLITASNAADNFCHQNKLQGCWVRSLVRLEVMAAEAEQAQAVVNEVSP
jgi:hypothetical protein